MRARLLIIIVATVLGALATRTYAENPGTPDTATSQAPVEPRIALNKNGFTLGDLFSKKLWIVVKPPLPLDALNRTLSDHGGHQRTELLTPGDAGLAIHVRW